MLNYVETKEKAKNRRELTDKIKELLVEKLDLEIDPSIITDDQPIFGRGLGLDSIDALELFVVIEDEFGVTVFDDNIEVFSSVNKLADYIEENMESEKA
ncbi:phosphopantetheine-binding protein [Bacillus safensis]|nr:MULTISPECIES: phosphopantetheine-binding protein [Bacillus]MCY1118910.1 phosphopantetheine-binding protein [Bacillus safensis]MCY7466005.1 phosphopantetheine-binding protein [Bacillus safensis]MDH6561663.1 acyl carrier protein [Bacillus sp. TBS-096]MDP4565340.1 phosphopantetheine-binding protein [Bacillus safensis]MEC0922715.1 phosphopantetheine-binding protein [Bacillus safensis]